MFGKVKLLMFAWIMNRPVNFFGPVFGLPMVGLGSLAVQRSIGIGNWGLSIVKYPLSYLIPNP